MQSLEERLARLEEEFFTNGGGVKNFTVWEIFEKIERWQRLKKDDQIVGKIPFVTAWFNNTWITNYISNPVAFFPWNSITIDMFWNVFYRDYEFWADDNISVYYDVNNQKSKLVNLYLTSVLSKKLKGTFSYGKQFRCSKKYGFRNHSSYLFKLRTSLWIYGKLYQGNWGLSYQGNWGLS